MRERAALPSAHATRPTHARRPTPRACSNHRPSASRWPPGCDRATSTSSSARRTSSASAAPPPQHRARSPRLAAPVGSARHRQDQPRPPARRRDRRPLRDAVCAVMAGVADVRALIAEAQDRIALAWHAHRPLPRRDPSLQQGPAGRPPAPRRGRHDHAGRRDDREPVLRGQLGAPVADAGLAAGAADRRGRRDRRPPRARRRRARPRRLPRTRRAASASAETRSIISSAWPVATPGRRSTSWRARRLWPKARRSATTTARSRPRLEDVESAAQQRVLAYDRAGDGHYDTVSAFIKSLRGNDPDAALYWLAAMIAAGEDPRFIVRRLIISASEDVGNADPRALQVAVAAAQALDHIGLPEAQYAHGPGDDLHRVVAEVGLGRARLPAPRWPTSCGSGRCRSRTTSDRRRPADEAARHRRRLPLPPRLRGRRRRAAVPPRRAGGQRYYVPGDQGYEATIAARMEARAEAARQDKPRRKQRPDPPMASMGDGMKGSMESRKKLAETQKKDAGT